MKLKNKINIIYWLLKISNYTKELAKKNELGKEAAIILHLAKRAKLNLKGLDNLLNDLPYENICVDPNNLDLWTNPAIDMTTCKKYYKILRTKEKDGNYKSYIVGAILDERGGNLPYDVPYFVEIKKECYNSFFPKFFKVKTVLCEDGKYHIANHRDLVEARKIYNIPNIPFYKPAK